MRYPGFKGYSTTVEVLKIITNSLWRELHDPVSTPSIAQGEGLPAPRGFRSNSESDNNLLRNIHFLDILQLIRNTNQSRNGFTMAV